MTLNLQESRERHAGEDLGKAKLPEPEEPVHLGTECGPWWGRTSQKDGLRLLRTTRAVPPSLASALCAANTRDGIRGPTGALGNQDSGC